MNYTSRSAVEDYQKCPRYRYNRYFLPVNGKRIGIVPKAKSVPLTTGTCVHIGIEHLGKMLMLKRYPLPEEEIQFAITLALTEYNNICAETGFYGKFLETDAAQKKKFEEQKALTEGLIRAWALVELPQLVERYNIVAVEREILTPLTESVMFQARVDMILKDKRDDSIYLYSLKNIKRFDERAEKSYQNDLQGITEIWATETKLKAGRKVMGVRFCCMIKGEEKHEIWNNKTSPRYQDTPLIRGYKFISPNGVNYAHSQYYPNPQNKSGTSRLGKGWEPFNVWEDSKVGIRRWLATLAAGRIQPEWGEILRKQVVVPIEYFREEKDIIETMGVIEYQEDTVFNDIKILDAENNEQCLVDRYFPKYRHHCHYPLDCEYNEVCWGGAGKDPIETGLYQIRTPHHKAEKESLGL